MSAALPPPPSLMDEESLLALPSVSQNIDRMAREISAKIARIYKYSLRKGGGRLSLNDSVKIVELFNYAASCSSEVVEAVKHRVSEEESDFKDMGDLIADLQPDQSQKLKPNQPPNCKPGPKLKLRPSL